MEEKHYIINEIAAFFSKSWTFIFTIMVGAIAKLSIDELSGKVRNRKQKWAVTFLSIFGGCVCGMYLISEGLIVKYFWTVPVATVFSETVVMWIIKNHKRIFFQILSVFTNKNGGTPPNDQVD